MSHWETVATDLPAVPPPGAAAAPQRPQIMAPPASVPAATPSAPGIAAPVVSPTVRIPGWVRVMAVIVSLVKIVPLLFIMFAAVVVSSAFGGGEVGIYFAAFFLVPVVIVGLQMIVALTHRRRSLQIISGFFAFVDVAHLGVNGLQHSTEFLLMSASIAVAQVAVFIGALVDPSK